MKHSKESLPATSCSSYVPFEIIKTLLAEYAPILVQSRTASVMSILFACAAAALGGVLAQDFWSLDVSTAAFVYARGNATRFRSQSDREFGPQARMATAIVFPRDDAGINEMKSHAAFSKNALALLYRVKHIVVSTSVAVDGTEWTYDSLCQRLYGPGTACSALTATQFWPDEQAMENDTSIGHTVGICTAGKIPCQDSDGQPIEVAYALGRGFKSDESGNVTSAPALFATFLLNAVPAVESSGGVPTNEGRDAAYMAAVIAWERAWILKVGDIARNLETSGSEFLLSYGTASSLEDEVANEAHADIPIIILSYGLMSVYLVVALSTLRRPLLATKCIVTCATVVGVVAALLLSAGIALASKVQLNPIVFQVLPFLLLAIGVDSTFQLLDAFQRVRVSSWGTPAISGIPRSVSRAVDELAGLRSWNNASSDRSANACDNNLPAFCIPAEGGGYRPPLQAAREIASSERGAFDRGSLSETKPRGQSSAWTAGNQSQYLIADGSVSKVDQLAADFGSASVEAGQSIFLSSVIQCMAFTAASFIPFEAMSAVCTFCAVGVAFNFVFFVLLSMPAFALDLRRQMGGRPEICCCARCRTGPAAMVDVIANSKPNSRLYQDLQRIRDDDEHSDEEAQTVSSRESFSDEGSERRSTGSGSPYDEMTRETSAAATSSSAWHSESEMLGSTGGGADSVPLEGSEARACAAWMLTGVYLPLFSTRCKWLAWGILTSFIAWWAWSGVQLSGIPVAFEQVDLLPSTSYMYTFLKAQDEYLGLGPPLLLVVNGSDMNEPSQRRSFHAMASAMQGSPRTLEQPPFDPIGDVEWYQDYCSPVIEQKLPSNATFGEVAKFFVSGECFDVCGLPPFASCQVFNTTARCPASLNNLDAAECLSPYGLCVAALCNIRGIHSTNLRWSPDNSSIEASRVQTYLQPLDSMDAYIGSMKTSWGIAGAARAGGEALATMANANRAITNTTYSDGLQPLQSFAGSQSVYSDSVYFEYYQQYVVLVGLAWQLFAYAGAAMLGLHLLYFLDVKQSFTLLLVAGGTMTTVAASLNWWGVGLNSTTVVNLVGTTGVVIELCVHLLAFAFNGAPAILAARVKAQVGGQEGDGDESQPTRLMDEKQRAALLLAFSDGGATTLSGITTTKLLGLAVLALAPSRLTRVYFLRPFLAAVAFGSLHALLLAPALLLCTLDTVRAVSWCCGYVDQAADQIAPGEAQQLRDGVRKSDSAIDMPLSRSSTGYGTVDLVEAELSNK